MIKSENSFLRSGFIAESLFRGWAAFILILGLAAALMEPSGKRTLKLAAFTLAVLLLVFVRTFQLSRSTKIDARWNRLGFLIVAIGALTSIVWIWEFDSVQISDFGVYFRCGTERHRDIEQWIDACQSNYLHKNLIYWTRSLLYSAPLGSFVGANYPAFKLYNAALHAATLILWFFGLRHYYGPRVAVVATAVFFLYPEWWFTLTLVSTDNAAIFCVIAFLLLLPQIRQGSKGILIVIGLSLLLFAANQLRTIGPLLVLTLAGWTISLQCIKWEPYTLLRAVSVLILYTLLNALLGYVTPASASEPLQLLKALSTIDFDSAQGFGNNYPWYEHFWFAVPNEWRGWVAIEKVLLEFSHGFDRWPLYLYHKAATLFSGSGYYSFASSNFTGFNPDSVFSVPASTVPFYPGLFPWLAATVISFLTIGIWALLRVRLDGPGFVAIIWLGAFALIVLGLGEVQARYSVLVAPVLSLLVAIAFFPCDQPIPSRQPGDVRMVTLSTGLGFVLLTALFGIAVLIAYLLFVRQSSPTLLATQSFSKTSPGACDTSTARIETSHKRVRIITPKGTKCASVTVPLGKSTKGISFFVSGSHFPFPFESRVQSTYRYQVILNGRLLLDSHLADKSVQWHMLEFDRRVARDIPREILLNVNRYDASKDELIDFSLLLPMPLHE